VEQGGDGRRDAPVGLLGDPAEDRPPLGGGPGPEPVACLLGGQQDTTLSAATTRSAKTLGVTNRAFFPCRSASVTPRAPEQRPQT
jgi:hypothetical protein